MISLCGFEPEEIGLPSRFTEFRPAQIEAIEQAANGEQRFQGLCLPTGSGKSVVAAGIGKATGLRVVILTATKGLQSQYVDDFGSVGMVDIRGKANYSCPETGEDCRIGPLEGCSLVNGNGCTYECQRNVARASDLVVTNYDYWIRANERRSSEQKMWAEDVDVLVLDEAHAATQKLSDAVKVTLKESWLREAGYGWKAEESLEYWGAWAMENGERVKNDSRDAAKEYKQRPTKKARDRAFLLDELGMSLGKIQGMRTGEWVSEMREGQWARSWEFDCLWPGNWAEQKLFCGVRKVVLMSATLRPASLTMLGIRREDMEYREWDRVFPAQNTPVYHVPTVRMNWKTSDEDLLRWVERIDEIIESRLDRKGIIHTVSYSRQQLLVSKSRFAGRMLCNTGEADSESAADVVEKFRQSCAPSILVSPSFSTGWDFPGRDCEWQIIGKVPYPYGKSKVMKARMERNPRYGDYLAMQDLVQATGRGSRSAEDRCEVMVVDDMVGWFMKKNQGMAPRWFTVIPASGVPKPGPRAPLSKSLTEVEWPAGSTFGDLEF